jgi:CelD/BcsL family acetyltransferase involved in cellulose biosynthesis
MIVSQIDPVKDPRWTAFLERHPHASVFHTGAWLEALSRTYGYEPVAMTTSAPGEDLRNVLVFCRIRSWLTGRRLISLPFSDHCEPLVTSADELSTLLAALRGEAEAGRYKYIELRPISSSFSAQAGLEKADSYCFHKLDLSPTAAGLFQALHKDCVQRKIHRAEREGLVYEEGRSTELLKKFYRLQVITRRRLQLPPQPFTWFRNLAECMGEKLNVRVASKDGTPVASIVTLQHGHSLVYKYGASDKAFSNLGGMQALVWRAIEDAKSQGLLEFDLGRSDWDNEGLLRFKDQLGAARGTLTYWRYPASSVAHVRGTWKVRMAKGIFSRLPNACAAAAGNLLYRHLG